MKRVLILGLLFMVLLSGCNKPKSTEHSSTSEEPQTVGSNAIGSSTNTERIILPKTSIKTMDWNDIFKKVIHNKKDSDYATWGQIGENYFGLRTDYDESRQELKYTEILIQSAANEIIPYIFPENLPHWQVGSGSTVTLQDRYLYEWRSYTSQFESIDEHDVKLTRVDGQTGKVEIVDAFKLNSPLIYLCKLDEERFVSYYVVKAPSQKAEYKTLTVATLYHINGTKKEIIREEFENGEDWTDSEGTLLERFAVNNGELFAIGRRRIGGNYRFFLYQYDEKGKLLQTEALPNMEDIIGSEQPNYFYLVGEYILFITYESSTCYICKRTPTGVELLSKGYSGAVPFAFSKEQTKTEQIPYIYFMESTVNDDDTLKNKESPLYAIEVATGKLKALNFPVPLEKPYFYDIQVLSGGDILVTYCEESYDPQKLIQYLLPGEEVEALFAAA